MSAFFATLLFYIFLGSLFVSSLLYRTAHDVRRRNQFSILISIEWFGFFSFVLFGKQYLEISSPFPIFSIAIAGIFLPQVLNALIVQSQRPTPLFRISLTGRTWVGRSLQFAFLVWVSSYLLRSYFSEYILGNDPFTLDVNFMLTLSLLLSIIVFGFESFTPTEFNEQGIIHQGLVWQWNCFASYYWDPLQVKNQPRKLILSLNEMLWMKQIRIAVRASQVTQVQEFLASRLPGPAHF